MFEPNLMEKQNEETGMFNEDFRLKIAEIIFCVLFFTLFIWLIYDECFNYDTEYEITTGIISDILEKPGKDLLFAGGTLHSTPYTNYTLIITLADEEKIELASKFFDEYNVGEYLKIRKVYRVKGDEKVLVNYNILTN